MQIFFFTQIYDLRWNFAMTCDGNKDLSYVYVLWDHVLQIEFGFECGALR